MDCEHNIRDRTTYFNKNKKNNSTLFKHSLVLSEKDFYPPEDTRYLTSGVYDIQGGDNFADYVECYFDYYDYYNDDK